MAADGENSDGVLSVDGEIRNDGDMTTPHLIEKTK